MIGLHEKITGEDLLMFGSEQATFKIFKHKLSNAEIFIKLILLIIRVFHTKVYSFRPYL
jgi:hypothetical protein